VAWRLRDEQALAQMRAMLGLELERAVGEPSGYNGKS
jgi:hypothetical protein